MINQWTQSSLRLPGLVVLAVMGILGAGLVQYQRMPVDAFPDISPIMVPVFAEGHGLAPEEIERQITIPVESAMSGLPGVTQIKSTSAFGMAVIYVYFEDSTDIYFARQLVGARLAGAAADLPHTDEPPTLGPISTGLGQVFLYNLEADPHLVDTGGKPLNAWLRELNDWVVKRQLQTVPGVTDILSMGGHVLQYQIRVNPDALLKYDLTLEELVEAVRANNRNVGGQFLVLGSEEHLVRGLGLVQSLDDIRTIAIKEDQGRPVLIADVAEVVFGREVRRGVVTHNGEKEVVSGLVLKLFGENTSEVIARLYEKIDQVAQALPAGVRLVPYYEQAKLVAQATWTIKKALLIGGALVIGVLVLFLGNLRTAFIVAVSLPVCAAVAVLGMGLQGISANLMSLGGIAIAIGMLGDGAIVMVENLYRHLSMEAHTSASKRDLIARAAREVNRPIVFSILIIIVVFLPLFSLQGVEGRMFSPMAFTIAFALLGSLGTAVLVAPVLSLVLLKRQPGREQALVRVLQSVYRPLLAATLRRKPIVMGLAAGLLAVSLALVPRLGTEFIPTLEEGSIQVGVTMAPSISLGEATQLVMAMQREIADLSPVRESVARIGRPEAGSHPHPVNYAEIHIELNPVDDWGATPDKAALLAALEERFHRFPEARVNLSQPIQALFGELLSGIRADLAIKVVGDDLDILRAKAEEIRAAVDAVPGFVDVFSEQSYGQPQVQVGADREACARYGISAGDIMEMVELAVGGEVIDQVFLDARRFGIHVRFQEEYRSDPEAIGTILIPTAKGAAIPLAQVAQVRQVTGPIQINREHNQRRWVVQGNIRGRDLGSVVADLQALIRDTISLPPSYTIEFGGQFENQQRAMKRLSLIVPTAIGLVLVLLWTSFGNLRHALIIVLNVPLALIGGILGLLVTGEYLSVPASVGFIALFGIAVQNGMVLVTYFNDLRQQGRSVADAVREGAELRLRPVLMTALTTVLGLLPLLLAQGIGSDVQRPLATVVVFGLTSSTLLTLFVLPAVYVAVEARAERRAG